MGIKRSLVGAYEEGRAEPKIDMLILIAQTLSVSLDQLLSDPISEAKSNQTDETRNKGSKLRVLTVAIDKASGKERISVVPVKAAAGYLGGYGDLDLH